MTENDVLAVMAFVLAYATWVAGMLFAFWATSRTPPDYAREQARLTIALRMTGGAIAVMAMVFVLGVLPHLLP